MSEQVIWLMDSDFCYNCDTELADVDGLCWWCWEKLEEEYHRVDDDEIDPEDYALDFDEQGRYIGG